MKDSKEILNQLEPKIAASNNNSATPAGLHNSAHENNSSQENKTQRIETINQCFELLRINYSHLYWDAYKEIDAVNIAKRLWLESLSEFTSDIILRATHETIKKSDFLPTVSKILKMCKAIESRKILPETYSAYLEACNSSSPRQNTLWSHPLVYHAGKKTNWLFLTSNDEAVAFPKFKKIYEDICEEYLAGKEFPDVTPLALPENLSTPLSKEENLKELEKLEALLNQ